MVLSLLFVSMLGLQAPQVEVGMRVPDVSLINMEGKPVRLSSFQGKKLILFNWASWWGCREQLPGWQTFTELNKDREFVFAAVAMDAGGVKVAKPIYSKANATFVTLVDPQNALSTSFGFDVIPNGYLIDEAGVLRYKKVGGFEVKSPASMKAVEEFLAQPAAEAGYAAPIGDVAEEQNLREQIAENPRDGQAQLALGRLLLRLNRLEDAMSVLYGAIELSPESASARFALGSALLAQDKKKEALVRFKEALRLERTNFVIRKQIWLLEHPEKFHPTIDWAWQREQLTKEREQEKLDPPGRLASWLKGGAYSEHSIRWSSPTRRGILLLNPAFRRTLRMTSVISSFS
jgi:peroxiredoxin